MKRIRVNGDRTDIKLDMHDGLATSERMYEITGEDIQVSDGYHTMDELYDHRITLYIALCRHMHELLGMENPAKFKVWRSQKHSDGSMYPGEFVMGIGKEKGQQITYHIPLERWHETNFAEEFDAAPEYDGHTSADVLDRLKQL